MTLVAALAGGDLWAPTYDATPNPVLNLEMRTVAPRLAAAGIVSLVDMGCGTGRWMVWAQQHQIRASGIDASRAMLAQATGKAGLHGRCAQAQLTAVPLAANSFDLAICAFALSYVDDLNGALLEFARIAPRVLVTDLHPAAETAGWKRGFESYELDHVRHSVEALDRAASAAGLKRTWRVEASFGAPERTFFIDAGKTADFEPASRIPAVLATLWERR